MADDHEEHEDPEVLNIAENKPSQTAKRGFNVGLGIALVGLVGLGAYGGHRIYSKYYGKKEGAKQRAAQTTAPVNYVNTAGVLGNNASLDNTNIVLNAPHLTRENETFFVERNTYTHAELFPGELSWMLRQGKESDVALENGRGRIEGSYLIPTLRTNDNGTPVKGIALNNLKTERTFINTRSRTNQETKYVDALGNQVNITYDNPLVMWKINNINYFMPSVQGTNGLEMRIAPATDAKSFLADGRLFIPGPVYTLNKVPERNYLMRSPQIEAYNEAKTNAPAPQPTSGVGKEIN